MLEMCDAYCIAKKVSHNLSGLPALLATVMFASVHLADIIFIPFIVYYAYVAI
jgi:hypothetical protein